MLHPFVHSAICCNVEQSFEPTSPPLRTTLLHNVLTTSKTSCTSLARPRSLVAALLVRKTPRAQVSFRLLCWRPLFLFTLVAPVQYSKHRSCELHRFGTSSFSVHPHFASTLGLSSGFFIAYDWSYSSSSVRARLGITSSTSTLPLNCRL